ncbi:MAG: cob(I)yrinic acid a,c-diamide adenosyltransferase [Candidatus Caldatribacteriaceae bacterium]
MNEEKGLVEVFFGDGKGKTSASLGVLLRAVGHGKRVLFLQFFKKRLTGEIVSLQFLPGVECYRFGTEDFVKGEVPTVAQREEFLLGWHIARLALLEGKYDLVVLDEFTYSLLWGLLSWGELREVLMQRRPWMEVIFTGRKAPQELLEFADLVSEIRNVKHPFERGIPARKGFEY